MKAGAYALTLATIAREPEASYWIKRAAVDLDRRDPVDALADVRMLLELCQRRLSECQS